MTQPTSAAQKVGHTPGPWFADLESREISGRPNTYLICRVSSWSGQAIHAAEGLANFRLIAIAPEMLAELKTVSWLLADLSPDGLVKRQIDALIARATRESEDV